MAPEIKPTMIHPSHEPGSRLMFDAKMRLAAKMAESPQDF
jgi:hypothetical protein